MERLGQKWPLPRSTVALELDVISAWVLQNPGVLPVDTLGVGFDLFLIVTLFSASWRPEPQDGLWKHNFFFCYSEPR